MTPSDRQILRDTAEAWDDYENELAATITASTESTAASHTEGTNHTQRKLPTSATPHYRRNPTSPPKKEITPKNHTTREPTTHTRQRRRHIPMGITPPHCLLQLRRAFTHNSGGPKT